MPQLAPITKKNLHRGMSAAADYLVPEGFIRDGVNVRYDRQSGIVRRNDTQYIRDLTEMAAAQGYSLGELDDYLVAIGEGTDPLTLRLFNGSGTAVTIQRTGVIDFSGGTDSSGATRGYEVGDTITEVGGATAIIRAVILDRGIDDDNWTAGTATGKLDIRVTSGTWPTTSGLTITNSTDATVSGTQDTYDEVDFSYLGDDETNIRTFSIENTILVWNTDQAIAYKADPGSDADVDGEVQSFNVLARKWNASVGDVWKTLTSEFGFPVGYYECYEEGNQGNRISPKWKRVPKPGQADALFDETTMPHRLVKIDASTFAWETPPWAPRLSGGDVEGVNPVTGEDLIRNPPELDGLKIVDITVHMGRLAIITDEKKQVLSQSGQFFQLWYQDIFNLIASDPIIDEVVGQNTGIPHFIESLGDRLFIQCAHRQFEFHSGDDALVAGGEGTPYNGRFRKIGDFEADATVRPASSGEFVFMMDSDQNVIAFQDTGSRLRLNDIVTDPVFDDITAYTPARLEFNNRTLYAIMTDGTAWTYRVGGVDQQGRLQGSWAKIELTEDIEFVWGFGSTTYVVTNDSTQGWSLLTYTEEDQPVASGFDFNPRLDRMESLTGTYDATNDETDFTMGTSGLTTSNLELHIQADVTTLEYDAGNYEPAVDDAVEGLTTGAKGTVIRHQTISGTAGGGDLKGRIWMTRSNYGTDFIDNELLKIDGTNRTNAANGTEEEKYVKGEIKQPTRIDSGDVAVFSGFFAQVSHKLGRLFTSSAKFHRFWAGITRRELSIGVLGIFHERTSDYNVRIIRDGRTTDKVHEFTSKEVGDVRHGQAPTETDVFVIDGVGEGKRTQIQIESSSSGPFRIGGLEYEVERKN